MELPLVVRVLGLTLFLIGVAIYLWCAWDFAVKGLGTPAPTDAPRLLVVKGLYRFTRNPMYVGVSSMILGQASYYGSFSIVVYLLAMVLACNLFVRFYEEPTLRRVFGEQYDEYCRKVPRWLLRVTSRDLAALVLLALGVFLVHTLTNGPYGCHRDELLTMSNSGYDGVFVCRNLPGRGRSSGNPSATAVEKLPHQHWLSCLPRYMTSTP